MGVFYRSLRRSCIAYEQTGVTFCCSIHETAMGQSALASGARGIPASTNREVNLFADRSRKRMTRVS